MTEVQRLKQSLKAAVSREQEANRNWSDAAKSWFKERERMESEIRKLKKMVDNGLGWEDMQQDSV